MKIKSKIEVLAVVLSAFIIVIVAPMILQNFTNETEKLVVKILLYVLLAGVPLTLSRIAKRPVFTLGFRKDKLLKQVLTGLLIFAVVVLIYTIPIFILGDNKTILLGEKRNGIGIIISYIIFDILFVGMGEETLFRGYFMERFHTWTNSGVWAVVISSVIFGIWHFPGGQDFVQVIVTALIGAIYATSKLKIKNCSTLSLGIAHGLHDAYILVLSCILL